MRIFVILSRVPWPLEKGDKLRAFHQLKELAVDHEICLFCLSDSEIHPDAEATLRKICKEVHLVKLSRVKIFFRMIYALFSKLPFQVHYFYQKKAANKAKQIIEDFKPDHIYCQLIRCSEYVKYIYHIPKTIDYMDAFSKGIERRIQTASFFLRPFLRTEAQRLVAYESLIFDYFENKTIITDQDRSLIYHSDQQQIRVIPNGVDFNFFQPLDRVKKYDLVFNGNMNYPPNIDCAIYLVKEILPELQKRGKSLSLLISGASPHPKVLALAGSNVTVSGWVNDQRESYSSAKIFVAPLRIGTGLQNKLLEAMAMKLPCITSTLANNALKATNGSTILIADTVTEYADRIIYLLENSREYNRIAENGYAFVHENFDWKKSVGELSQLMLSKSK